MACKKGQLMPAAVDRLPEANKLYVGEGVSITGAVLTSDTVVVDGFLEGEITVNNLLVGETGTIKGRISVAQNAEIFGLVFERLAVKGLLVLRSSCRVDGSVSCGTLQIEQGATLTGDIQPTDYRADQSTYKFPRRDSAQLANGSSNVRRVEISPLGLAPDLLPATS